MIVPGSLSITEGRTGHKWFVCVVEGGDDVAIKGKPVEDTIEEIAAVDGVNLVELQYFPRSGKWFVFINSDKHSTVHYDVSSDLDQVLAAALNSLDEHEPVVGAGAVC